MKTTALAVFLVGMILGAARAEAGSRLDGLKTWFKHLRQGLMESSVESYNQKHRGVTAVAAVRGAKQGAVNPDKPEWKTGAKSSKTQLKKERQELAMAAERIISGDFQAGRSALDAFETDHPASRLKPEAEKMRAKLQELESLESKPAAPEPAPASDDAPKDP